MKEDQRTLPEDKKEKPGTPEEYAYFTLQVTTKNGEEFEKWLPSFDLLGQADRLLSFVKNGRENIGALGIPFIVTLCTFLEAVLNDFLLVHLFLKYHEPYYRRLYEAFEAAPLRTKLVLAVEFNPHRSLRVLEGSEVVTALYELIGARNKIVHPSALFSARDSEGKRRPSSDGALKSPIHTMTLSQCVKYQYAVHQIWSFFLDLYYKRDISRYAFVREMKESTDGPERVPKKSK